MYKACSEHTSNTDKNDHENTGVEKWITSQPTKAKSTQLKTWIFSCNSGFQEPISMVPYLYYPYKISKYDIWAEYIK